MSKQQLIEEMEKAIIAPTFINDLHKISHKNIVWSLKDILIFKNESLYPMLRESIDSFVNSQIDVAQKKKRRENWAYWQWVQRKLIKLSRAEEGVTEL